MKTCKNILLISGIASVMFYVVLSVVQFITYLFTPLSGINYVIRGGIIPTIIAASFLVSPVLLLVRNLKNKAGRVLPIICIVISGITLSILLFSYLTPTISKYIIYSKLGVLDTYVTTFIAFFKSGGILFLIGFILVLVGSILSLVRRKEKQA